MVSRLWPNCMSLVVSLPITLQFLIPTNATHLTRNGIINIDNRPATLTARDETSAVIDALVTFEIFLDETFHSMSDADKQRNRCKSRFPPSVHVC